MLTCLPCCPVCAGWRADDSCLGRVGWPTPSSGIAVRGRGFAALSRHGSSLLVGFCLDFLGRTTAMAYAVAVIVVSGHGADFEL